MRLAASRLTRVHITPHHTGRPCTVRCISGTWHPPRACCKPARHSTCRTISAGRLSTWCQPPPAWPTLPAQGTARGLVPPCLRARPRSGSSNRVPEAQPQLMTRSGRCCTAGKHHQHTLLHRSENHTSCLCLLHTHCSPPRHVCAYSYHCPAPALARSLYVPRL